VTIDVTSLYGRRADNRWDRCSVGDVFERVALVSPDREAMVGRPGAFATPAFERLTYAQADDVANRFANALLDRGIERGARVLMICGNSIEAYVAKIGIAKAGAVSVAINPVQTPEFLEHVVALTEPSLVMADDESAELLGTCASLPGGADITIPIGGGVLPGSAAFADVVAAGGRAAPDIAIHGDDICEILFTSGTTALPKGVMISHNYAYLAAMSFALPYTRGLRHESELRYACFTPIIFHIGYQAYSMPALFTAGAVILGRRFSAEGVVAAAAQEGATAFVCSRMTNQVLAAMQEYPAGTFQRLTCMIFTGGTLMPETAARLVELAPDLNFFGIAGQTESVSAHRFFPRFEPEKFERSADLVMVGKPTPLLSARIVDAEGGDIDNDVDASVVGELVYRSPIMAAGYYRDREATERAFDGGWFHSGDLAYRDDDGDRVLAGRLKDMIKTGGENVPSLRVENVLNRHPLVERSAVIGVPDARWGEAVTAVVVAVSPDAVAEAELIAFCRERLAGFETPKSVLFVDALPLDFQGKVRKAELRATFAAQ
jgi:acyl-CoA synthetase (AMP-forming)/AMP-acid ligase II